MSGITRTIKFNISLCGLVAVDMNEGILLIGLYDSNGDRIKKIAGFQMK